MAYASMTVPVHGQPLNEARRNSTPRATERNCSETAEGQYGLYGNDSDDSNSSDDEFPDIRIKEGWARFVELVRKHRKFLPCADNLKLASFLY